MKFDRFYFTSNKVDQEYSEKLAKKELIKRNYQDNFPAKGCICGKYIHK